MLHMALFVACNVCLCPFDCNFMLMQQIPLYVLAYFLCVAVLFYWSVLFGNPQIIIEFLLLCSNLHNANFASIALYIHFVGSAMSQ